MDGFAHYVAVKILSTASEDEIHNKIMYRQIMHTYSVTDVILDAMCNGWNWNRKETTVGFGSVI